MMPQIPPHTPLFTQHSRNWRKNRYIYPVVSRRSKGLSIGINLNTDRICNFDCVYCCVDRAIGKPSPQPVDIAVLRDELDDMLARVATGEIWQTPPFDQAPAALKRFNDIAFSGDGEPTSSPVFAAACELAAELRSKHALDGKIVVITNATLLDRPGVQNALKFLDAHNGEVWAKLDAGNENVYRQMVRTSIPFPRVLEGIRQAGQDRQIVIQSMFLSFSGASPAEEDIVDYLHRLRELTAAGCHIRLVQIYTIARPVFQTHIAPLPDSELDTIAARVQQLGINAEAYYAAPGH